jgi:HlyD family secretion protein
MKNKMKAIVVVVALTGGSAAAVLMTMSAARQQPDSQMLVVRAIEVKQGIDIVGKTECDQSLSVTAPFDAVILEKKYADGEFVGKGQPLLLLSSSDIQVRLEEQLAEKLRADAQLERFLRWESSAENRKGMRAVRSAAADVEDSRRKVAEAETLYSDGIIPKMEFDATQQQLRATESNMMSLQEELVSFQERQRGTERRIAALQAKAAEAKYRYLMDLASRALVTAPISGIVTKIPSPGGQSSDFTGTRVTKDQSLLKILNIDSLVISALLNESEINKVQVGQAVDINNTDIGLQTTGRVLRISSLPSLSSRDAAVPKFEVKISVPDAIANVATKLRVGATVDLKIITYHNPAAIVVPLSVLRRSAGGITVEILEKNEHRKLVSVQVKNSTSEGVEVDGLAVGTRVVSP